eukprot:TRINITY_DN1772_c0_g2_i8.p1 TRINITY_DN1772_c0_g2~~TRINITY_DN1772_c0_g2_i8.p1  ORF type:complete len:144 (+),score=18.10 TRINITY_DN1772_c0_g2_i8:104-535(+)
MVKKNNDNVRNLDVDTFSRIHFLIQASYLMKEKLPHLSRFYANTALGISQKLVVRLHPGLKELVCARCGSFTLPGEARYRLRRRSHPHQTVSCGCCKLSRKKDVTKKPRVPRPGTVVTSHVLELSTRGDKKIPKTNENQLPKK